MEHKVHLTLGSNAAERCEILATALAHLEQRFDVAKVSDIVQSPDVCGGPTIYANCIVVLSTSLSLETLSRQLHAFERRYCEGAPPGEVILDIDIITYDDRLLKPADIKRDYYLQCESSI